MQKTCTCSFLHGAETSESVIQQVDKALEGQQEYHGEVCFYRKNGGDLPTLSDVFPKVIHLVFSGAGIDHDVKAELNVLLYLESRVDR